MLYVSYISRKSVFPFTWEMLKENELWKAKLQGFLLIREIKFPKDKTWSLIEPDRTQKLKTSPWYSGIVLRWDKVGNFHVKLYIPLLCFWDFMLKGILLREERKTILKGKIKIMGWARHSISLDIWGSGEECAGPSASLLCHPGEESILDHPVQPMSLSNSG